jgi:anti-sigma regulatory factor (Ser/Thr protein kinase)
MPEFSGPEALQLLKDSGHDVPLILVSGTAPDQTGIDMMRAGARDFILKSNLSRLSAAVEREIAEAEQRKQRRRAEQALRESEAHRIEFYRRTIIAATDGKLVICDKQEIERVAGAELSSWQVLDKHGLSVARDDMKRLAGEQGMDESQIPYLLSCVVEAGANAIKHASGGRASLHKTDNGLLFLMSDDGPGIGAMALPDVALTRGYSTSRTLGMGYKLMMNSARRMYLATDDHGTTVAVEIALCASNQTRDALLQKLSGWLDD